MFAGAPFTMENDVLEPTTKKGFDFSPAYFYGEPANGSFSTLTFATREDDSQWSGFVRWIIWSLVYAEEQGFGVSDAPEMPLVDVFGANYERMFQYIVLAFGNYGELYEKNLGSMLPRSGGNLLNDGSTPLVNPSLSSFLVS